ncbi:MAG: ferritin [Desulfurococcales archaeon]|nr:ferritin [Desulfurococcales archaeon]
MSGWIGVEVSPKFNKDKVVEKLLSLFADEWIAGYYYMVTAYTIKGPHAETISEIFLKESREELEKHAKMIADRLQDFDVDPPRDFKSLYDLSGCKYPELPNDPYDIDGFIIAAIKAELCAIKGYKELYDMTHGPDPVTEELAEDLLRDETRHRTELVNLLSKEGLERLRKELTG